LGLGLGIAIAIATKEKGKLGESWGKQGKAATNKRLVSGVAIAFECSYICRN